MFYESRSENPSSEGLKRDLVSVREMAADYPQSLRTDARAVYRIIEAGLHSPEHFYQTSEAILNLLAVAVTEASWKDWFDRIAELVEQAPVEPENLYQVGFREVIADFRPLIGIYGARATARAVAVADLLTAYTKLFQVIIFRHGMPILPELVEQAEKVAERLGDHVETDKLYQTLALYYTHIGEVETAKQYARLAFTDSAYIEHTAGTLDAAATLAIIHRRAAEFRHVDYYIGHAMHQIEYQKPDKLLATLYYEYAILCYRESYYDLALSHYAKALTIFEEYEAPYQITMTRHAMVQTYVYMHAFNKVEPMLYEVRDSWKAMGSLYNYVNSVFLEGEFEIERGNLSLGRRILYQTKDLAYEILEDTPARDRLIMLVDEKLAESRGG